MNGVCRGAALEESISQLSSLLFLFAKFNVMKSYKVKDSYKITDLNDIFNSVVYYYNSGLLDENRSIQSYVEEWFAHNWLYNLGLFKSHTRDTDLDGDESLFRRICYKIIFKLFTRRIKNGNINNSNTNI